MTDPYQQNNPGFGGPQYGPPGTGPDLNKPQDTAAMPQYDSQPYAQQPVDPYAQPQYGQANPYGQQPGAYPPAGYGPPGYNPNDPEAPWGRDQFGVPFSDKQKLIAGLLQIFLGAFGVGRFYTGYTGIAIAQIAVTWLTCGIGGIWPLVDGILMLIGKVPDSDGRPLRD
ncbi:TM2 domain-containing membrane protein YozV [Nocardia tenerifensis]|uniref:TM2 domain-containing membrane protein YozV n=1 Tax=Nocardia tenerifensis TaxID=228006 RepID=A0A318K352_9NOCA|nr:TM2 domain-containing protein [Nocardia tenerifensis]PXX62452.1 TM2 domain-containing membrane protein YozV [Nocardia tenerifensis]